MASDGRQLLLASVFPAASIVCSRLLVVDLLVPARARLRVSKEHTRRAAEQTHESEEKKPMVVCLRLVGVAAQDRTEVSVCGLLRCGIGRAHVEVFEK